MAGRALLLAAALPAALAFSDTLPVVAWSSHKSDALDSFSAGPHTDVASVLASLLASDSVCAHDAIVLVDQPGLHASDLRTLAPSALLAQTLKDAPSTLQLPYVPHADGGLDVQALAGALAARCGSAVTTVTAAEHHKVAATPGGKHVVCLNMPALASSSFAAAEAMLSDALHNLAALFPSHLVALSGSAPSSHRTRQFDSPYEASYEGVSGDLGPVIPQSMPPLENVSEVVIQAAPSTKGGILAHYQLLTAPLLVSLFVTFFLAVPGIMFGIRALSSIQAPAMDVVGAKGFNADTKKNQ